VKAEASRDQDFARDARMCCKNGEDGLPTKEALLFRIQMYRGKVNHRTRGPRYVLYRYAHGRSLASFPSWTAYCFWPQMDAPACSPFLLRA
jgi:hypothetical protein